ncbi:hypothetical protein AUP68_11656 [Ilyonectria robusta]
MGCLSHRKKQTAETADQRWEYINLKDFKAKGCGTVFAYIYLWFMLIISIAVYAVDSFTAVNLLAFNRWSGGIDPAINIDISKWIFSICIILSFLNLGYEGIRAIKVIRRGNVAECYMDSLAVRWESIRLGSGLGFRRFLVFAELTKSKKGAEYIALFTYFSFQSWIRVIICSGPRQVINAFTIKAVYDAKLAATSDSVGGSITAFFQKIKDLAESDYRQALTLSGMCFTLVIWVFSALFLLAAVLFWLFFLWHWIPSADGGLSGYCSRKVTKTLMKIVTKTVNKALAREEANRLKAEFKAAKKNGEKPPMERIATLPTLPNVGPTDDDKIPSMPMLGRNDTMATLPAYSSRPGTPGGVELSNMDQKRTPPSRTATGMSNASYPSRPAPSRTGTMASNASYPPRPAPSRTGTGVSNSSYSSRAPLISTASEMGYGRPPSPTPQVPNLDYDGYPQSQPTMPNSHGNFGPQAPFRPMLSTSSGDRFTETPAPMRGETLPFPPPARAPSARPMDSYSQSGGSFVSSPISAPAQRSYEAYNPDGQTSPVNSNWGGQQRAMDQPMRNATAPPQPDGRASPAPTVNSNWGGQQRPINQPMRSATAPLQPDGRASPAPTVNSNWGGQQRPMNQPMRSATGPLPPRGPQYPPQRNMTAPTQALPPVGGFQDRYSTTSSVTSNSVAPSSMVLPENAMRASPAPRMGPSPGPGGPPQGYDVESQRGRERWN